MGVGRGLISGSGRVGMFYVCVSCESGFFVSRYLYIVLGGYLRILGASSVQSCCTLFISASYRVFIFGRYRKFFLCCCRTWICLDITRLYEEKRQPSSGSV